MSIYVFHSLLSEFLFCVQDAVNNVHVYFSGPTVYFVYNETIYTNQSTAQSTPTVAGLCTFAPECFCTISECPGLLFDGDTASTNTGSIDLQNFWAFDGSSDGRVKIILSSNTPVTEITLHFYNSPNELIGLPDIEVTNDTEGNSIPFLLADNNDLSQTDSQVRSVGLSLDQGVAEFFIHFMFPDNIKIQYMLISEIVLTDAGNVCQ